MSYWFIILFLVFHYVSSENCTEVNEISLPVFNNLLVPALIGHKGDTGKIAIVGGSVQYSGAPYFAAISALKAGADLVYVITTASAAPIIKSYSPDLIVLPYLHSSFKIQVENLLHKMDAIVIGPGLGRETETISLVYDIIGICRKIQKPLVIDADGLYAVFKNVSVINDYPSPGAILTPNHIEADRLQIALSNSSDWDFGDFVSVLIKGKVDIFYSRVSSANWQNSEMGSGRRAAGQGDILAGILGTFYNWSLKANICETDRIQKAQSLATYAAAKFTRLCNSKAFEKFGRSMVASDMINEIYRVVEYVETLTPFKLELRTK